MTGPIAVAAAVDRETLLLAEQKYLASAVRSDALKRNGSEYPEVELALIRAIAPLIPEKNAVDVGAFKGGYTDVLRNLGFRVWSFEPLPELAAALRERYKTDQDVRIVPSALADDDGTTELLLATTNPEVAGDADPRLFSSTVFHDSKGILSFDERITVPVRRLRTLIDTGVVPKDIGILKVDTEGQDVRALEGAWPHLGQVTFCEYWNEKYVLADSSTPNDARHYLAFLEGKGPYRTIVFARDLTERRMFFQVDTKKTVPGSFGNILITKDERIFAAALDWCVSVFGGDGMHM